MAVSFIMAGGFGKRLWPESRINHPKQFLSIKDEESLIRLTYRRCINFFGKENTFIITRRELIDKTISHIPEIPPEQIIGEPEGRDTAPCIGFAAICIQEKGQDTPMVFLPSDHLIENGDKFNKVMEAATKLAEQGYIVTVGIKPTRAETGYGYIEVGDKIEEFKGISCHKLRRFTEKPSHKKAKSFLESGNFLWNAGIFAWRPSVILEEIKKHHPQLYEGLQKIKKAFGTPGQQEIIEKVYPQLPKISIDYAVMEKTKKAVVIPGEFIWDDVGEWQALLRIFPRDERGNITWGLVKEKGTSNCILVNREEKLLGVIGVSDLVVINSKRGILIVSKELSGKVKEFVDELMEDEKLKKYVE